MSERLTDNQEKTVSEHHGFLEVEGRDGKYIVMSMQVYREMMGVGSDQDYQASLQAIEQDLADIEAGYTKPMDQVFCDLDDKYGVHGS